MVLQTMRFDSLISQIFLYSLCPNPIMTVSNIRKARRAEVMVPPLTPLDAISPGPVSLPFSGPTLSSTALSHPPHSPRTKSPGRGGRRINQRRCILSQHYPTPTYRSGCLDAHQHTDTTPQPPSVSSAWPPSSPSQSRAQPLRQ